MVPFSAERGTGRGFAFARYKNLGAYATLAVEVSLDHESAAWSGRPLRWIVAKQ